MMKTLNAIETQTVSGGACDNDGYNFSFIVNNAVTVGIVGGLLMGNVMTGAAIGAGYAGCMLVAKSADNYFFPEKAEPVEVSAAGSV